ncbi:hypothetical protein ACFYOI_14655 [Streptomyces microflavus]|uniref:hypothetical protein n=1 Tax=Streptomyces microflavus TaxID=1919 RepID=UPI0033A8F005
MDDDYLDDEADEGDRFSDAIRILLLVAAVAAPLDDTDQATAPVGAVAVLRSRISIDHGTCGSNRFPAGVIFPLCAHEDRASR